MAAPSDHHVSEADAFTLQLERDPSLRATIVAVVLLDRSPDWERFVDRMERATRELPTFRQKLVGSPFRLATPRWVPDGDFDLGWHLRRARLPAGGDLPELLTVARNAAMTAFDHDRPLWQFTLIEGLAGGRAALVLKVHHALTDGIGGVQIAAHVVDLDRTGAVLGPRPDLPAVPRQWPFEPLAEAIGHDVRRAMGLGGGAVRSLPSIAAGAVRHPVDRAVGLVSGVRSIAKMVRPVTDTRSPVMRRRGLHRHFEAIDVPFAPLRAAGAVVGGTMNDAFIAAIAGGMRIYHEQHLATVGALRVTMPISMRGEADEVGGNHVTLVRFDLPVGIADPVRRMRAVHEICSAERAEPAIDHSEAIAGVLNLLPVSVTGGLLHHVDLLASNVPGLATEVFVAGARVDAFYPFGATLGSAGNITLMSYRGICHVGVNTDGAAVPDPDVFVECLRAGFDEILSS